MPGRYERTDVRPRVVLAGALGLVIALLLAVAGITLLETWVTGVPPAISRPADLIQGLQAGPTPALPRLEPQSGADFATYHAAEEQKLTSYRWVDRNAGTVTIPIDRAMDLVAQRGLPTRAGASAPQDTSPSSASSGRAEAEYP